MSDTESKEVSTDEPAASTAQGVQNDTSSDFLTESEKEVLQEWTLYITGLFAAVGVAIGLNVNIQDQWSHFLVSNSQGGTTVGTGFGSFGGVGAFMTIGIVAVTVLGYVYARNIDNENQTAYKVAAATAIVGIPVLSLVGGFLGTQPGDGSLEFVNVIVSGLGSGIAGAVGAAIVVYLTEEQAPDALSA